VEDNVTHLSNSVEVLAEVAGDLQFRGVVGDTPGIRTLPADFNLSPSEVFNMFIGQEQLISNIVSENVISEDAPMAEVVNNVTDMVAAGISGALDDYYTALPEEGFPVTGTVPYTFQNSMIAKPETPSELIMREFFLAMVQNRIIDPVRAMNFPINSFLTLEGILGDIFVNNSVVYFQMVEDSIAPLNTVLLDSQTRLQLDRHFMAMFFSNLVELVFTPPVVELGGNSNFIRGAVKGIIDLHYTRLINVYTPTSMIGLMTYQLSRSSEVIRQFMDGETPANAADVIAQNSYLVIAGNAQTGYEAPI